MTNSSILEWGGRGGGRFYGQWSLKLVGTSVFSAKFYISKNSRHLISINEQNLNCDIYDPKG